ncbi:MAG: hypothetical protein M3N41_09220 [Acidobacteriota bacterium]|nr:hypothetical protein [Acidobacteriota bacterium]
MKRFIPIWLAGEHVSREQRPLVLGGDSGHSDVESAEFRWWAVTELAAKK